MKTAQLELHSSTLHAMGAGGSVEPVDAIVEEENPRNAGRPRWHGLRIAGARELRKRWKAPPCCPGLRITAFHHV